MAGPFFLKGILRADDAERAVAIGADAIAVSNHGAKVLDGTRLEKRQAVFA